MKKIIPAVIFVLIILGFGLWAGFYYDKNKTAQPQTSPSPTAQSGEAVEATFNCDEGKIIYAVFNAQASVDLTLSDGRQMTLLRAVSGSGARYATANESIVFWNKDDTAFIDEGSSQTYSNCLVQ